MPKMEKTAGGDLNSFFGHRGSGDPEHSIIGAIWDVVQFRPVRVLLISGVLNYF